MRSQPCAYLVGPIQAVASQARHTMHCWDLGLGPYPEIPVDSRHEVLTLLLVFSQPSTTCMPRCFAPYKVLPGAGPACKHFKKNGILYEATGNSPVGANISVLTLHTGYKQVPNRLHHLPSCCVIMLWVKPRNFTHVTGCPVVWLFTGFNGSLWCRQVDLHGHPSHAQECGGAEGPAAAEWTAGNQELHTEDGLCATGGWTGLLLNPLIPCQLHGRYILIAKVERH